MSKLQLEIDHKVGDFHTLTITFPTFNHSIRFTCKKDEISEIIQGALTNYTSLQLQLLDLKQAFTAPDIIPPAEPPGSITKS